MLSLQYDTYRHTHPLVILYAQRPDHYRNPVSYLTMYTDRLAHSRRVGGG